MWEAFKTLSASRGRGEALQPISYVEIASWLDLAGFSDPELRQEWTSLIAALDHTFLEEVAKRQPKAK